MQLRIGALAALGLFMVAMASACAQPTDSGPGKVGTSAIGIPTQILGLKVQSEDISKQTVDIKRSYADSLGMFSMRESDLLRATLQVSRLSRIARPQSRSFRRSIVELLGGSTPVQFQVGETTVYSTSGNKQNIFAWFDGRGLFILSVHQDYEFPRTLLRKVVALDIK